MNIPYNAALNPDNFTIEAWAKTSAAASDGYQTVVSSEKSGAGYALYQYKTGSSDIWRFCYYNGSGFSCVDGPAIVPDQWTHLAGTYDGTTFRLYVNGELANSVNGAGFLKNDTEPMYIGADYSPSDYYTGKVDEVRVWNAARDESQIKSTMYNTPAANATGLVARYRLNESTGANAPNSCTNTSGIDGTLINMDNADWMMDTPAFPVLHLRADKGTSNSGSNLTSWVDQARNNDFSVTGTPGYQTNALNSHPVVTFDNDQPPQQTPAAYLDGDTQLKFVEGFTVFRKTNASSGAIVGSTVCSWIIWRRYFFRGG